MSNNREKPALGIIPKRFWIEQRCDDIMDEMNRYRKGKYYIPPEWIEELAEHIRYLDDLRKKEGDQ